MAPCHSTTFDAEFKSALSARGVPDGEIYSNCIKVLTKHKLVYKLENVHPRFFLTHRFNRGGLMLSPHNAHRNATRLYLSKAADKKQLVNAVCFELPPIGETREMHIEANLKLVSRAKGFLAPVTGEERYVTVGCGHTVAFCKNAAIGGKTPSIDLQDAAGNIDPHKIAQHEVFGSMVNDGWDWLLVNSKIDEYFPQFAKAAQKALNVSNHVASEMSELECAKILADNAADAGFTELENWKALALENVRALSVPCAGYAQHILKFVQYFAGGTDAPLINFLDDVAKQFHCNVNLGGTFWQALSHTIFHDQTKRFPLVRVAFALTNLTSDKVEDGISRLLVKTDLTRLATKAAAAEAWELEQILQDSIDIVDKLSSREAALQMLGQFLVRLVLKLTKKEKVSRDPTERSVAEIQTLFLEDLGHSIGQKIQYEKWNTSGVQIQSADTSKSAAPAPAAVASLSDHGDAKWVAEQNGFRVGQNVVKRGASSLEVPESLFVVFAIGSDEVITLKQICTYNGRLGQVTVKLAELIKDWTTTKADAAVKMNLSQQRSNTLNVDLQKSIVFKALIECDPKTAVQSNLVFLRKPDSVRVGSKKIQEGALVLAPIMSIINISTKNSASAISFGKFDIEGYPQQVEFFGLPMPKPFFKVHRSTDWPEGSTVVAYWWVDDTSNKKLVNMVEDTVEKHGVTIPILRNSVPMEPHTKLYRYKAAPPKRSAAPIIEDGAAAAEDKAVPAAKKRRTA